MSPETIWSQSSGLMTGCPPSRTTTLYFTVPDSPSIPPVPRLVLPPSHNSPPPSFIIELPSVSASTAPKPSRKGKERAEPPLVDWSRVNAILQETVLTPRCLEVPHEREIDQSDDSTPTLSSDEADNSSACATPKNQTVIALPPVSSPAKPLVLKRKLGSEEVRNSMDSASSVGSHMSGKRYDGPWGRAAAIAPTGDGLTVGDLLMERWSRSNIYSPSRTSQDDISV